MRLDCAICAGSMRLQGPDKPIEKDPSAPGFRVPSRLGKAWHQSLEEKDEAELEEANAG